MKALAAGTHSGWTVRRLLATAILLAVSALAVIGAVSYVQITTLISARAPIERSHQVLEDIDALLTSLTSAETGQRGYLLTGDASYLRPYAEAIGQIDDRVAGLRELVGDNPRQQATLDRLDDPVARKLAELDQTVMLRRTQGLAAAQEIVLAGGGARDMATIRGLLSELRSVEKEVLVTGERADAAGAERTKQIIVWGSLLAALIVAMAALWVARHIIGPIEAVTAAARRVSTGDLSVRAPIQGPLEIVQLGGAVNDAVGTSSRLATRRSRELGPSRRSCRP